MPPLEIRQASSDSDWHRLLELLRAVYVGEGYSSADRADAFYQRSMLDGQGEFLIAISSGEVVGAVLRVNVSSTMRQVASPGDGEFRLLAVSRFARGLGAGRALVEECLCRERLAGSKRITICTQPRMSAAQKLYDSFGFVRQPGRDFQLKDGSPRWVYELNL